MGSIFSGSSRCPSNQRHLGWLLGRGRRGLQACPLASHRHPGILHSSSTSLIHSRLTWRCGRARTVTMVGRKPGSQTPARLHQPRAHKTSLHLPRVTWPTHLAAPPRAHRASAVVELSADDLDPGVARPPRRLRVVGGRDHGLMVRVRSPSVDADRFGCAGTLASARDQVRNPDWIGNAPVQFAALSIFFRQYAAGVSSPDGLVRPSHGWRSPPRGEKRGDR